MTNELITYQHSVPGNDFLEVPDILSAWATGAKRPELFQHRLHVEDLKSAGLDVCVRHPRSSSSVLLLSPLMVLHHHFSHGLALLLRGNFEQVIDKPHRTQQGHNKYARKQNDWQIMPWEGNKVDRGPIR